MLRENGGVAEKIFLPGLGSGSLQFWWHGMDMEAKGGGKGACATPGAVVDVKPMGGEYFLSSGDSAPKFL